MLRGRTYEPANEAALLKTFIKAGPPNAILRSFNLQTVLQPPRLIRTPRSSENSPQAHKKGVSTPVDWVRHFDYSQLSLILSRCNA